MDVQSYVAENIKQLEDGPSQAPRVRSHLKATKDAQAAAAAASSDMGAIAEAGPDDEDAAAGAGAGAGAGATAGVSAPPAPPLAPPQTAEEKAFAAGWTKAVDPDTLMKYDARWWWLVVAVCMQLASCVDACVCVS